MRTSDRLAALGPLLAEALVERVSRETGIPWVREYQFHPRRRWRFDFAFPEALVALEIEGAVWTRGRHTRGAGFLGDVEKYNAAAGLGWRLVRTPWEWIHSNEIEPVLVQAVALRGGSRG